MTPDKTVAVDTLRALIDLGPVRLVQTLSNAIEHADHPSILGHKQMPAGNRLLRMIQLALAEQRAIDAAMSSRTMFTNAGCAIEVEAVGGVVSKITTPAGVTMQGILTALAPTHVTFLVDGDTEVRAFFDQADCPDKA